jgi:glutamyl endopeptidase
MTPGGYEYGAPEDIPSCGDAEPNPLESKRGFGVIGADTRSKVSDTTTFPYRAIAQVDYDYGRTGGGCTATMISRNTALTAAHCLFDYKAGTYKNVTQIAPGRYRFGGIVFEPYGVWYVAYTHVLQAYIDKGKNNRDIGIIKLHPKTISGCEHTYPGDVVGYVEISKPAIGDSRLSNSRVTGYPGDKPFGEMWTSGQCSPGWNTADENFGIHFCDTYGGNSGSSILTTNGQSLGVDSHAFVNPTTGETVYNGACLMHGFMYDDIFEWSGRGSNLPRCTIYEASGRGSNLPSCAAKAALLLLLALAASKAALVLSRAIFFLGSCFFGAACCFFGAVLVTVVGVSGACLMHGVMYDYIYEVSGRGSNLPSCAAEAALPLLLSLAASKAALALSRANFC